MDQVKFLYLSTTNFTWAILEYLDPFKASLQWAKFREIAYQICESDYFGSSFSISILFKMKHEDRYTQ